jgi:hypothetical protein
MYRGSLDMKILLQKGLLVVGILVGLLLLGLWEEGHKKQKEERQAPLLRAATEWFEHMLNDRASEAMDLCGFPFDANGVHHAANREELEAILPQYLDIPAGCWPWTASNVGLLQFHQSVESPNRAERRSLAKGTVVIVEWVQGRTNEARIYVRPGPEPKVVGFKVSELDKGNY